eukprot:CAMPEP_0174739360 /NCGR_PEP_ID=MMETSP1094-20130205/71462_1 /TAXON_ID=156173 /ORGANISM="Chrysochromulina brevifilum, Strain UTEX LB 985" /LENGTH=256 /DNA_ID=CAMNT_0015942919 /DNA_START=106 /DNA_END=876 /DNA_ORIENTATION=+
MPRGGLITQDLLCAAASSSQAKLRPKESTEKFLARQTHLHLNDRRLTSSALPSGCCPSLKALYLFDNEIQILEGLGPLAQLTHLYAQNNSISEVASDVGSLTRLRKLYLNGNRLRSLTPLAPLVALEELQVSSQKLPAGMALDLGAAALGMMSGLRVLAVANNGLMSVNDLKCCKALEVVDLSKNQLRTLADMADLITAAPVRELDLRGNEISDSRVELDSVIVASPTMQSLNGRDLMQSERPYLQHVCAARSVIR